MYIYIHVCVRRERSTNGAFSCSRLPGSFVCKRCFKKNERGREREGEKSMNNQSTLLFFLLFDIGSPASQQSNCILLLNIPCFFSFSLSRSPFCSLVDMTIGTKSRERENTHKYIEHDGEMMKEDEDE